MEKIWEELLCYESSDLVKERLEQRNGRKPSNKKVHQIVSNFYQGREYFLSAKSSSISVKPLLQYYGVMALSKGLILYLSPTKMEEHLKSSHGLSVTNWKEIIKNQKFENALIKINAGTFLDLIQETQNTNYLRSNSSGLNWKVNIDIPTTGMEFSLKEFVGYFPDLREEYLSWTGRILPYIKLQSYKYIDDGNFKHQIELSPTDISNFDLFFPKELAGEVSIQVEKGKTIIKTVNQNWYPNITQLWESSFKIIGDACIVPVLQQDKGFNLIGALYGVSYFMGMFARYFPTSWISLRMFGKGDRSFSFFNSMLNFIEEKYPLLVLDFLKSPYPFEQKTGQGK